MGNLEQGPIMPESETEALRNLSKSISASLSENGIDAIDERLAEDGSREIEVEKLSETTQLAIQKTVTEFNFETENDGKYLEIQCSFIDPNSIDVTIGNFPTSDDLGNRLIIKLSLQK